MKKIFNYVLLALVTVCFALPLGGKAEAAKVAVVPLANHVAGDELAGTIYMQEALALFRYPEFDLLGEDVVLEAIGSENGLADYSKAALEKVAQATGADVVVAMQLDKLDAKRMPQRKEATLKMDLRGKFASLNTVTGAYYYKDLRDTRTIEEAVTVRGDWEHEVLQNVVRNAFKKVAGKYCTRAKVPTFTVSSWFIPHFSS